MIEQPGHLNVVEQKDHLHFYCDHKRMDYVDFLFASSVRQDFDEIENPATGDDRQDLKSLLERIEGVGGRGLVVDLTTPDVAALGLSVVRALIPGFHPLFMGYGLRALGGHRLWQVPQRLGYAGIEPAGGDNPLPHPYP